MLAVRLCAAGEGTSARYRRHQGSLNVEGTAAAIGHRPARIARASVFGARTVAPRPLSDRKIAVRLTRPCPRQG